MTTWLTTGEAESCGTENKGTAVNKYTCGGRLIFCGQFFRFCLFGMPPYFNRFISKVCGNLNIIYSVLKRALLVKSPSSASLHRQNFNVTWQGPQNLYSIRDLNVNCGSNSLARQQQSAIFRRGQKQPKKICQAENMSFLRLILNLQIYLSIICNIYHVIVHLLPKKH